MTKTTLATLKSFIRKNGNEMFINVKSSFDGMIDGFSSEESGFSSAQRAKTETEIENNLGYSGIWIVSGGMDYIQTYNDNNMTGFEVSNCCGCFVVAVAA